MANVVERGKACCGNCMYSSEMYGEGNLLCARYPPTPSDSTPLSVWPIVGVHAWCGEYRVAESLKKSHGQLMEVLCAGDEDE